MEKNNQIRTGLWSRKSQNNTRYFTGKIEIDGKVYYISLFNNNFKKSDKSPDLTLCLKLKGNFVDYSQDYNDEVPEGFAALEGEQIPF